MNATNIIIYSYKQFFKVLFPYENQGVTDMGEACSLCSNIVILPPFMTHKYYEIDVDDKNYLYQILFDYTCMFRIGCKPMMLITSTWLKLV
jgi:hypothetical protein